MKINSVFESISGEAGPVIPQGAWSTFIRTQGCNFNPPCGYCDTPEALSWKGGIEMSVDEILSLCQTKNILITGGEPLLQPEIEVLVLKLLEARHIVQIETNGSVTPALICEAPNLGFSVDVKLPSSDQLPITVDEFVHGAGGFGVLLFCDVKVDLKFVFETNLDLADAFNFINALEQELTHFKWAQRPRYVFSPMNAGKNLQSHQMMEFIRDQLKAIDRKIMDNMLISVQVHKILGLP